MAVKINALYFSSLPNAAHYNFFQNYFAPMVNSSSIAVGAVVGMYKTELNEWLSKETALMNWQRSNPLTESIREADKRIDKSLAAIDALIKVAKYSPVAATEEAGKRLEMMRKTYGDVARMPYETEEGAIQAIIDHLNGDLAAEAQTAGITSWVSVLQTELNTFHTCMLSRNEFQQQKPPYSFAEIRKGIETVYRLITEKIDAAVVIYPDHEFPDFVAALNPQIDHLNSSYKKSRKDIAPCQPEPIPQQQYTGKPVTPSPRVFIYTTSGTSELELGKDYNLSYKNNTEVGNAECAIRGKGLWKGKKVVTFIIAR